MRIEKEAFVGRFVAKDVVGKDEVAKLIDNFVAGEVVERCDEAPM